MFHRPRRGLKTLPRASGGLRASLLQLALLCPGTLLSRPPPSSVPRSPQVSPGLPVKLLDFTSPGLLSGHRPPGLFLPSVSGPLPPAPRTGETPSLPPTSDFQLLRGAPADALPSHGAQRDPMSFAWRCLARSHPPGPVWGAPLFTARGSHCAGSAPRAAPGPVSRPRGSRTLQSLGATQGGLVKVGRRGARPDPGPRDPHCRLPPAGVSSLAREPAAAASPNRSARGGAAGRGGASGSPPPPPSPLRHLVAARPGVGRSGRPVTWGGNACARPSLQRLGLGLARPAAPGPLQKPGRGSLWDRDPGKSRGPAPESLGVKACSAARAAFPLGEMQFPNLPCFERGPSIGQ